MALKVTNVSGILLLIRLRSGNTLRLSPGEQTGELADAEVRDNPRVETLVERNLVRIDDMPEPKRGRRSGSSASEARSGASS